MEHGTCNEMILVLFDEKGAMDSYQTTCTCQVEEALGANIPIGFHCTLLTVSSELH